MSNKVMTVVVARREAFGGVHEAALEVQAGRAVNSDVLGELSNGWTVDKAVVYAGKSMELPRGWKAATLIGSVTFG